MIVTLAWLSLPPVAVAQFWIVRRLMMYGGTTTGLVLFLIEWIILLSLPWLVLGFVIYWIIRTLKRNKKAKLREQSLKEEVRCLGCGAVIDKKQQACQICGWTWK